MATETPRWPQRRRESAANEAAREEVDPRVIIPGRPACTNDCLPYIRLGKLPGTRSREISEGPKGPAVDGATAVRPSAGQAGSLQPVHFGSIQIGERSAEETHQAPATCEADDRLHFTAPPKFSDTSEPRFKAKCKLSCNMYVG